MLKSTIKQSMLLNTVILILSTAYPQLLQDGLVSLWTSAQNIERIAKRSDNNVLGWKSELFSHVATQILYARVLTYVHHNGPTAVSNQYK